MNDTEPRASAAVDADAYTTAAARYLNADEYAVWVDAASTADVEAALRQTAREVNAQQLRLLRRLRRTEDERERLCAALERLAAGEQLTPERYGIRVDPKKSAEDGGAGCIAEGLARRMDELSDRQNALETLLDRCGGHKARVLQLLIALRTDDGGITVDFGAMPEPGEPYREDEA